MAGVNVQAQRLPGIGWRYSLPADQDRELAIVVENSGPRHLALIDPSTDESLTTMQLSEAEASAVAALLTGARLDIQYQDNEVLDGVDRRVGARRFER
jgi:K+/H+ antiporter YhaU regulatory subunit KhtT